MELKKTVVVGMGVSGCSAVSLLLKNGVSVLAIDKNYEFLLLKPIILSLLERGVIFKKELFCEDWKEIELLVLSPGVPLSDSAVVEAQKRNIEIVSEVELGFRYLKNVRAIGITGSNGKTTTTLMVEHILNENNIRAKAVGNIGHSICDYAIEWMEKNEKKYNKSIEEEDLSSKILSNDLEETVLVVELSSYQLELLSGKNSRHKIFERGVILNISQNHLDRYPSFMEYGKAKCNLQNCLVNGNSLIVSKSVANEFSKFLNLENLEVFDNFENDDKIFLAAFFICKYFGIDYENCLEKIKNFKKPPHRIEFVTSINNIFFYNDSKATSVDAVVYAVKVLKRNIILIVGGRDKGLSYEEWNNEFGNRVKEIFAIGECAGKIRREVFSFDVILCDSLEAAVRRAFSVAKENDVILLSPGCSSFDMFENYEHRGNEFKNIVYKLKGEGQK